MGFLDSLFGKKNQPKTSFWLEHHVEPGDEGAMVYRVWQQTGGARQKLALPLASDQAAQLTDRERHTTKLLDDLRFDGHVRVQSDGYRLPLKHILDLDPEYREMLDLGPSEGWQLHVDVQRTIGKGQKSVELSWTAPDGTYNPPRARFMPVPCGFYEPQKAKLHLLSPEHIEIRELVEQTDLDRDDDRRAAEYRMLGQLERLLERAEHPDAQRIAQLKINQQLEREAYIAPERIGVTAELREDGGLNLAPEIEGLQSASSREALLGAHPNQRLFTGEVERNGVRKKARVALDATTQRAVAKVRKRRHIPAAEVADFVKNPRAVLEPASERRQPPSGSVDEADGLDLTSLTEQLANLDIADYGERVIGFEAYERRDFEASGPGLGLGEDFLAGTSRATPKRDLFEDLDADDDEDLPTNVALKTAENDIEVAYSREVSALLKKRFEELETPHLFSGTLYPHQQEGYAWLRSLQDAHGDVGGLLADDMGLGKTVQVISLFAYLKERDQLGPSLLVVPKTVIRNWQREIETFCPTITRIYEFIGPNRRKNEGFLRSQDVIITTYTTLWHDELLLGRIPFQVLVCDEAQRIKNYTTRRASACRAMDARLRLPLTATPVENTLVDLWSIVDFAQPGLLGSLAEFRTRFKDRIEGADKLIREKATRELLDLLQQHYLRRTKEGELADELPAKHIHREKMALTPIQEHYYQRVRTIWGERGGQGAVLGALQALLRVCAHPMALTQNQSEDLDLAPPMAMSEVSARCDEVIAHSAKLTYTIDKLRDIERRGEKVIIFTGFRRFQVLLRAVLEQTFGLYPHMINGTVSGDARHAAIEQFNKSRGFNVIIMSPGAAGVGVNVTGANHVFHLSREWNPAKENQATDRAYRIGQTRDVHVYLPIVTHPTLDTIDVKLDELLQAKSDLAKYVIVASDELDVGTNELKSALG